MEGLVIFLIPTSILKFISQATWQKFLWEQGFSVLKTEFFSNQEFSKLNGINFPINNCFFPALTQWRSGLIIIGFDLAPIKLTANQRANFSDLDNDRYLLVNKFPLYYQIPAYLKDKNLIYVTKNSQQAEQLLDLLLPQEKLNCQRKIAQLRKLWITNYPVERSLTTGKMRRAKVELIKYQGKLAVKKTYRPGCERFLERELFVMLELGKIRTEIPSLLSYGSSFFICPFYEKKIDFKSYLKTNIDLKIAQQIIQILRFFYDLGYALIDFNPSNCIIDRARGLKIIDFEFLYPYKNKPASFAESYDLIGIPPNFEGDTPIRTLSGKGSKKIKNYNSLWQPYLKLELSKILEYC